MTAKHAFVDESTRRHYLLCATVVGPTDLSRARRALRELCRPGQRRVHMNYESDNRRRQILSTVTGLDVGAHIYRARIGSGPARASRDECLRAMVLDMVQLDVVRLVVESCNQDHQDNQIIREVVIKTQPQERLTYFHSTPTADPLLWISDVVVWAYGRGGDWRRRAEGVVAGVTDLP